MSYHDILVKVGDFGLYQKLLCGIFVFYTTFLCGLNFYTQVFFASEIGSKIIFNDMQVFIFNTPAHRCSDDVIDFEQGRTGASWEEVLPWVPRETGYPSSCHMLDASSIEAKFRNLSTTYFSSLKMQDTDPDQFTAIRCLSCFALMPSTDDCQAQRDQPGGGQSPQVVRPGLEL